MNILVIEDEKSLAKGEMSTFLKNEGYICDVAYTGKEASEKDFLLICLRLPFIGSGIT